MCRRLDFGFTAPRKARIKRALHGESHHNWCPIEPFAVVPRLAHLDPLYRFSFIPMSLLIRASAFAACFALANAGAQPPAPPSAYGIQFACAPAQLAQVRADMPRYLQGMGIGARWVSTKVDRQHGTATYSLTGQTSPTGTLFLRWRSELEVEDAVIDIPTSEQATEPVVTVSRKEIVLALLHPGRLTRFTGRACTVQALADHVGVRQNTVMWAEVLGWRWPDGGSAEWNPLFWNRGTPQPGVPVYAALNDMFFQQSKYAIGCYTATKMVYAQAVLDYYRRVKGDAATTQLVLDRLMQDGEPLVDIEPGRMWSFEADFDHAELHRPGKLLRMRESVAAANFVPGDWVYFLNTDAHTYQKTGYEGSNAIYLGRNRFDDYYNDFVHHYSYKEKLGEVYQWRNGVFSRRRDYAKREPLSPGDFDRLSATPEQGGLLMGYRIVPYYFGFEPLPALPGLIPPNHVPASSNTNATHQ